MDCGSPQNLSIYKYIYILYYIRPKINTIRKSSVTWRKIPIENPRIIFDSQLPFHVTKQYRIHPEILGGFNSSCCCLDAPRTSLVMRWPSFGRRIDFYGGPFDVLSFFFKYVFENDNRWYNLHFCTSITTLCSYLELHAYSCMICRCFLKMMMGQWRHTAWWSSRLSVGHRVNQSTLTASWVNCCAMLQEEIVVIKDITWANF